jgi:hypothetical protein
VLGRDSTGHEVDILMDLGDRLVPVEVKSCQTVAVDAADTLIWWSDLARSRNGGPRGTGRARSPLIARG